MREKIAKAATVVVVAGKKTGHYVRHFFIFLGPVANSVKGQLTSKELQRAAVKAALGGGGIYTGIKDSLSDPTAQNDLWAPILGAIFIGSFSLISDYQTGHPKPPDPPPIPPPAPVPPPPIKPPARVVEL